MDARLHNRDAWNYVVKNRVEWAVRWSTPVSVAEIAEARVGRWQIILTPCKPVPETWLPKDLRGKRVLCLASGGGQQAPLIAAAGARVTSFDISDEQLACDRLVADRDGLALTTVQGDMNDLSPLAADSFDYVVNVVSNCFAEQVRPMWRECFRVLARGGALISAFNNPIVYAFDAKLEKDNIFQLKNRLPYSSLRDLSAAELESRVQTHDPLEFSHTLEDQIGGQIDAGFLIAGFYEDYWKSDGGTGLDAYMPQFLATRALKP